MLHYSRVNDCLEERYFEIEHVTDAAPFFRRDDLLFKLDVEDA